ncbi:MAG: hypothetical protein GY730_09935 [bacterium]|nr:hypothetical protein [bacterium]
MEYESQKRNKNIEKGDIALEGMVDLYINRLVTGSKIKATKEMKAKYRIFFLNSIKTNIDKHISYFLKVNVGKTDIIQMIDKKLKKGEQNGISYNIAFDAVSKVSKKVLKENEQ